MEHPLSQDGGAHKAVWHCKGDAGIRICFICRNLIAHASAIKDEEGAAILTSSIIHEEELDFATDDDVRESVMRLAQHCGEPDFALRQQAVGFRHEAHGILMDRSLDRIVKPVSHYAHDWMHTMLVSGVFNTVAFLFFEELMQCGNKQIWETCHDYLELWVWPAAVVGKSVAGVFQRKRVASTRKAGILKCTASESLSLYSVLAYFVLVVVLPSGACIAQCKAFLTLCDIIDLLQSVPLGVVSPALLSRAVKAFLDFCTHAKWQKYMHPKFHWMIHFIKELERFGCLPTCFVHERKHRVAKRYANDICNTKKFEVSVLGEVICHNLAVIAEPDVFNMKVGLAQPRKASKMLVSYMAKVLNLELGAADVFTSNEARLSPAGRCARKDIVLVRSEDGRNFVAGEVWVHADVCGELISVISLWSVIKYDRATSAAEWRALINPQVVSTHDILCATIFTHCRAGVVRTLVPYQFRSLEAKDI